MSYGVGAPFTNSNTQNNLDGASITAANWHLASWWTTGTNWDNSAWDIGIWIIEDGRLPVLRNVGGTQNPVVH